MLTHGMIGGEKSIGDGDNDTGGSVGSDDVYSRRVEPVLVLLSDLYSNKGIFVSDSRLSSYLAYTVY